MHRSLVSLSIALFLCCLFPACSGEPDHAGLPTGPIAYALPDGTPMPHAPACSSPPSSVAGCTSAAACDDHNPCTVDGCAGGTCSYQLVPVGDACGAGASCEADGCCSNE